MEEICFQAARKNTLQASAVTVGNFDGVHAGHRKIMERVMDHAKRLGVPSVVMTFEPHPREVIYPGQSVPSIFPFPERVRLISDLGVDYLVKVEFTTEFASLSAKEFVSELKDKFGPRVIVLGHDFRFGKDRQGDEEFLRQAGQEYGFEVEGVPVVTVEGKPVSSTRIRGLIQAGEMQRARKLLGPPYHLQGRVIPGHGRGEGMGFPTANLSWENTLIPPEGVYAATAEWDDSLFPAVVNIGSNPTFEDQELSIEAHLMDFQGDLQDKNVRLGLIKRLRGEVKFSSPEELVEQIKKDVEQAREVLAMEAKREPDRSKPDRSGQPEGGRQ